MTTDNSAEEVIREALESQDLRDTWPDSDQAATSAHIYRLSRVSGQWVQIQMPVDSSVSTSVLERSDGDSLVLMGPPDSYGSSYAIGYEKGDDNML